MNEGGKNPRRSLVKRGFFIAAIPIALYLLVVGVEELVFNIFIHNQTTTSYTASNSPLKGRVNVVETKESGYVWIGTENGLYSVSPDGSWTHYTTENSGLLNNNIRSLAIYGWNTVWVGTSSGLCVLDLDGEWKTYFILEDEDYRPSIPAILVDHSGRVWVGTSRGLYMYEPGQDQPSAFFRFGVPFETITALAVDKYNKVWVGTRYGLRMVDSAGNWKVYNQNLLQRTHSLISDDITALVVDTQDRLWVGTAWGVSILHPNGTWAYFLDEHPNLTEHSYSYSLDPTNAFALDKQGRVWFAQWRILTAIDLSGNVTTYPLWYSDLKYISDVAADKDGRLWLGTAYDGLKVVDLKNGVPKPVSENWINARSKLQLPLRAAIAFIEPILMWIFLPAQFGLIPALLFFACLVGIVFGVMGIRRGIRESSRSKADSSSLILAVSIVGALVLWSWACLLAFLFLRD